MTTASRTGEAAPMGQPARQEVELFSDGHKLSAWFYPAREATGPAPAFVLCPGFTGNKYAAFYRPFVATLTSLGANVLLFDYRGWGDSGGPRGAIYPMEQVADVRNCLTYLETRPEVDPERMGTLGMSFGGGHAIYAAALDDRVSCVIALSPVADGRVWLRRMRRAYEWEEYRETLAEDRRKRVLTGVGAEVDPSQGIMLATPERGVIGAKVKGDVPASTVVTSTPLACADAILDYRPIDVVGRVSPRPLLVFYVEHDVVVTEDEHTLPVFEAAGEPKTLVKLPPSSHYAAYVECYPTIGTVMTSWLGEHMGMSEGG